jgi:acylphosphatase
MKHLSIHIYGKVQGVFFRASAKEKADELNITGLTWNNEDGSVTIEAEGEEENLKQYTAWCWEGPPLARVHRCEIKESAVRHFRNFSIQR